MHYTPSQYLNMKYYFCFWTSISYWPVLVWWTGWQVNEEMKEDSTCVWIRETQVERWGHREERRRRWGASKTWGHQSREGGWTRGEAWTSGERRCDTRVSTRMREMEAKPVMLAGLEPVEVRKQSWRRQRWRWWGCRGWLEYGTRTSKVELRFDLSQTQISQTDDLDLPNNGSGSQPEHPEPDLIRIM